MSFFGRVNKLFQGENAFSVIEVMMAMTIMSLVLLALLGLLVTSMKAVATSKLSTIATQVANEIVEKMHGMNYELIGIYGRDPEGILHDETQTVSGVDYGIHYNMDWVDDIADSTGTADNDEDLTQDYKQVTVTVSWMDKGTIRSISAKTFIKNKPAQTNPPTVEFTLDDEDPNTPIDSNKTPPDGTVFGTDSSPYKAAFDAGQIPLVANGIDPDGDLVTMHFFIGVLTPAGGNYSIDPTDQYANLPLCYWDPNTRDASDTTQYIWSEGTHEVTVEVWDSHGNRDARSIYWTIDRDAPSQPTGLVATRGSSDCINLTWGSTADGLDQVKRYQVFRTGPNDSSFTKIVDTEFSPTSPSYNSNSLSAWSTYQYYITAVSVGGRVSDASAIASATTMMALSSSVSGSGTSRTVTLTWTAKPSNATVTRFEVYRDGVLRATISNGSTTSYADSATKQTTYSYTVKAYNETTLVNESAPISVYTN